MKTFHPIKLTIDCLSLRLRGLTVCFIDESSPYAEYSYSGYYWPQDYTDLINYTGKTWHKEMIVFVPGGQPKDIYPEGSANPPCPISTTTRNTDDSVYVHQKIIETFGSRNFIRDVYLYVDTSGSMDRDTIEQTLGSLYANYSSEFNFIELSCNNERWVRWILNAEMGIPDCS